MNKKFIWSEKYSVNVVEIDKQHEEFVRICNDLLDLAESESFTEEQALKKVMRLGDYASYHLETEEELFTKTKYPDSSSHKEEHDLFRKKSNNYINQARDENIDTKETVKEVANFAGEWILKHILTVDKKYSDFFNSHEVR